MWRWVAGSTIAVLAAALAGAYVYFVHPQERRITRAQADFEELRVMVPRRWEIAPGVGEASPDNLVPSTAELESLERALPRPIRQIVPLDGSGHDAIDQWKRGPGHPPFALVDAIAADEELRSAVDAMAIGDHGAATDADGDRLDEAILWMIARAWADDERCLQSVVDAIRVGQAINPVPRSVERSAVNVPVGELEVVFSVKARLAQCARAATTDARQAALAALVRLNEQRPFPASRAYELSWIPAAMERQERAWDEDYPFASDGWQTEQAELELRMSQTRALLSYDGPFLEMEDPRGWADHPYPEAAERTRFAQAGIDLLVALLHYRNSSRLDPLGEHPPLSGGRTVEELDCPYGRCLSIRLPTPRRDGMVDGSIYLEPEALIDVWRAREALLTSSDAARRSDRGSQAR